MSYPVLRPFEERDRDCVIALWQEAGLLRPWNDPNKDIDRKLAAQKEPQFLVLYLEERLIGSVMFGYDGHRGNCYYFAILPNHQGKGYGTFLLSEVEKRLEALGCPKVNIMVRSANLEVLAFYRRLGYEDAAVQVLGKRLIADEPI